MTFPMPKPGFLTSTDHLLNGDILRGQNGRLCRVRSVLDQDTLKVIESEGILQACRVAFIGRPDLDGWMPWQGGNNPVPGWTVEIKMRAGGHLVANADDMKWSHLANGAGDIVAFRLIASPSRAAPPKPPKKRIRRRPETPIPTTDQRMTAKRKARIIAAIDRNEMTMAEAQARYNLTDDELATWQGRLTAHGVDALRQTKFQEYRAVQS